MRHKSRRDQLSRFSSLRKATIKSLTIAVLENQRIITTKAKAKAARRSVEHMITLAKENTLAARRRAFAALCDHALVKILFDQIGPTFGKRNGGYTRIIAFRNRRGDDAHLALLELTETYKEKKPKEEKKKAKAEAKKQKEEAHKPSKQESAPAAEAAKENAELQGEHKKQEQPTASPAQEAEKPKSKQPSAIPEELKRKKPEEKKAPGLFKGFKGFFKKERDSL